MNTITAYHQRTKHSLKGGYAKGPETLDWDEQPDPFRRFDACPIYTLPKPGRELATTWAELDQASNIPSEILNLDNVGLLLELAFGLSAWKAFGPSRWALRCNPSSGNLHPTEVYLINGVTDLLPQGVYHYVSHDHHLEQRCTFENEDVQQSLLIGLSSIHWREAWKYGERAFRYCQLDVGHALASLSYAASVLGWRIELLSDYSDADISCLLGLNNQDHFIAKEGETADLLCRIHYNDSAMDTGLERESLINSLQSSSWLGKAQSLEAYHVFHWPVIDEVSQTAQKDTHHKSHSQAQLPIAVKSQCTLPASQLIRQRRSAQNFNAKSAAMSQQTFFRLLAALSPNTNPPFNAWNWSPAVHLCLFVHNVEGLVPGLYCLPRSEQGLALLQAQLSPDFKWQAVEAFPSLYLLYETALKQTIKTLSCHQPIASDSAFSLSMLAEFKDLVAEQAWHYRRLFWECGLIGQILYLEAEAVGLRGTGIGCFFDDDVHGVLGMADGDKTLQSLYHFTVGESLEDSRIQTLPAYGHLGSFDGGVRF